MNSWNFVSLSSNNGLLDTNDSCSLVPDWRSPTPITSPMPGFRYPEKVVTSDLQLGDEKNSQNWRIWIYTKYTVYPPWNWQFKSYPENRPKRPKRKRKSYSFAIHFQVRTCCWLQGGYIFNSKIPSSKFFIYYWHPCVGRSNSMRLKIHLISVRCFFGFGSKNGSGGGGWITHLFFFEIIHKSNWIIYFLGDVWCVDVICKVTQSSSRGFDMKKQSWFPSSEKTWPSVCKLSEIT